MICFFLFCSCWIFFVNCPNFFTVLRSERRWSNKVLMTTADTLKPSVVRNFSTEPAIICQAVLGSSLPLQLKLYGGITCMHTISVLCAKKKTHFYYGFKSLQPFLKLIIRMCFISYPMGSIPFFPHGVCHASPFLLPQIL